MPGRRHRCRTEKTILDIALDFGYASPESFTRAFKSFYSLTPSEYRERYTHEAVTWHDLSGRIAISRFRQTFPELKVSDVDLALDFCFTHNPLKYGEDILGMTEVESEILTLGNPEAPEHFLYVSDYNAVDPSVMMICEREEDALRYLRLLAKLANPRFSLRRSPDGEWEHFNAEVAKLGLTCRYGYDMVFAGEMPAPAAEEGLTVRRLTADDLPLIRAFKQGGGCADCHVRAIQTHFDGKGNPGMRPMGILENGELIGLSTPYLDQIREFRKCDIGAIFTLSTPKEEQAIALLWEAAIALCRQENAVLTNANADEDDYPLGVEVSERAGLIKAAKNCGYRR